MTNDLVKRLRVWADLVSSGYEVPAAGQTMFEAADALEAKDARIAEMEAVIEGERDARWKTEAALRAKDEAMSKLFAILDENHIDYSELTT